MKDGTEIDACKAFINESSLLPCTPSGGQPVMALVLTWQEIHTFEQLKLYQVEFRSYDDDKKERIRCEMRQFLESDRQDAHESALISGSQRNRSREGPMGGVSRPYRRRR